MSKLLLALVPAARPEPLAVFPDDATVIMFRANTIKGIGTITINNNKNQQIGYLQELYTVTGVVVRAWLWYRYYVFVLSLTNTPASWILYVIL